MRIGTGTGTGTGTGKNSREFEAFSRCPRTPGQTPTATELASPHTAGPQTPPITAEFLPVSLPSVLPPSVLRSSLHVSTDCTPRTGALVERLPCKTSRPTSLWRVALPDFCGTLAGRFLWCGTYWGGVTAGSSCAIWCFTSSKLGPGGK